MRRVAKLTAAIALAATVGAWIATSSRPHFHDRPTAPAQCAFCVVRLGATIAPRPLPPPVADTTPIALAPATEIRPVFVDRWAVAEPRGPPA